MSVETNLIVLYVGVITVDVGAQNVRSRLEWNDPFKHVQ